MKPLKIEPKTILYLCPKSNKNMSQEIRNLEPQALWNKFADLNAVPRASKKEERVIAFMKQFGEDLGFETHIDKVGNVIIKKPATPGMENRKLIVMQSHLDMVHQKNNDTNFDFDTQGIEMYIDGDWVRATIMAILESKVIKHPDIEALFTIDEETGMTGAMGLEGGLLNGEILLNLDTEEDDEIGIGCAGGVDVTATRNYTTETPKENSTAFLVTVKGLQGGHSGMDIHKGLGNANKLMNRLLFKATEKFSAQIGSIDGGSLRNAIPRESNAVVVISNTQKEAFLAELQLLIQDIKTEFKIPEPTLKIEINETAVPESVMNADAQKLLVKSIYAAHNGIFRMSPAIEGLVETSNNIARVLVQDSKIHIGCLTRSSVESSKMDLANSLRSTFELMGCDVTLTGDYPGWEPNPDSAILKVLDNIYYKMNNQKANVAACHAGLECGILGQNYPGMDMISFGPTIRGAHSPDERASISSAQKYWKFVLEILENIPEK